MQTFRVGMSWQRKSILALVTAVALLIATALLYAHFFGPADVYGEPQEFIVNPETSVYEVTQELRTRGFIKSSTAFSTAFQIYDKGRGIQEGGYKISSAMDTLSVAKVFASTPSLAWVTFPNGWRKEQIADLLTRKLGWSQKERTTWIDVDTAPSANLTEGVYYGDTYLIPTDQPPSYVAQRLRDRFQDVFAPYATEALQRSIPWTDVIIMASLIEREASKNDRALVSGILWNRMKLGMMLQVDATLQYVQGTKDNWWPLPTPADKKIDSPFNTYKYTGLPPHPIANPSLASIEAALNPQKTSCIYYLHDAKGTIHCSPTYAGHVQNVHKYLK